MSSGAPSPPTDPTIGGYRDRLRPLLKVLLFWCACIAVVPLAAIAGATVPRGYNGIAVGLIGSAALLAISIGAVRLSRLRLSDIGMAPDRTSPLRLLAGIGFGLLLVVIYAAITASIADIRWAGNPTVGANRIAIAAAAALLLSCLEEIAFRGYALRRLAAAYGLWPAQFMVAIAFIVSHLLLAGWPLVAAIVGTGLGSLLFGMAAIATRGLAVPIGVHAAWNFGMWAIGTRELPAVWQMAEIDWQRADLANGVAYPIVAIAGILVFWWQYRRGPGIGRVNPAAIR